MHVCTYLGLGSHSACVIAAFILCVLVGWLALRWLNWIHVLFPIQRWLQARDCPTHVYVVVFMLISLACKRDYSHLGQADLRTSLCE